MNVVKQSTALLLIVSLVGCGGGGGSSSTPPAPIIPSSSSSSSSSNPISSSSSSISSSSKSSSSSSSSSSQLSLQEKVLKQFNAGNSIIVAAQGVASTDTLAALEPYCSADFSWHGKGCKEGLKELILIGNQQSVQVVGYDETKNDQIDSSIALTNQTTVATRSIAAGYKWTLVWKKGADGEFYLAGDGGKKAEIAGSAEAITRASGIIESYILFRITAALDSNLAPVADNGTVTGPGLNKPIAFTLSSGVGFAIAHEVGHEVTTGEAAYALGDIRAGVTAGTPFVITLKLGSTTVATYNQTIRVAPYANNYLTPSHLTHEDSSSVQFASLNNLSDIVGLVNIGGSWTPSVNIPTGASRTATFVGIYDINGAPLASWDQIWALATIPFTNNTNTTLSGVKSYYVGLHVYDNAGHKLSTDNYYTP